MSENENNPESEEHPIFGNVIFSYTRADAIRDGVLIDLTETAQGAGIKYPVAITATAMASVMEGLADDNEKIARLWELLLSFRVTAQKCPGPELQFELESSGLAESVILKALCGPGDTLDPVITIMLPHED